MFLVTSMHDQGITHHLSGHLLVYQWNSHLYVGSAAQDIGGKVFVFKEMWRRRMGVEPTIRPAKDRIAGFEGRESHRTLFASGNSIAWEWEPVDSQMDPAT